MILCRIDVRERLGVRFNPMYFKILEGRKFERGITTRTFEVRIEY